MNSWWYTTLDDICKAMQKPCHRCQNLIWKRMGNGLKCHCKIEKCNYGKKENDNAKTEKTE